MTDRRPRVLLVEDEFLIRLTLEDSLQDLGFEITAVGRADEAMVALRDGASFDVLLTDVNLPGGVSGPDLAMQARALHPDLPVLYATGQPDVLGYCTERDALLAKPFLPSEAAITLWDLLRR